MIRLRAGEAFLRDTWHWEIDGRKGTLHYMIQGTKETGFHYTSEWANRSGNHIKGQTFDDDVLFRSERGGRTLFEFSTRNSTPAVRSDVSLRRIFQPQLYFFRAAGAAKDCVFQTA